MALIACKECAEKISDSAPSCPRCGVQAPAGDCAIVFSRPSLMGFAGGFDVYVDGMPYGSLRSRGRIEVPVSPGGHHIEVENSQGYASVGTVSVQSGEVHVTVSPGIVRPKVTVE